MYFEVIKYPLPTAPDSVSCNQSEGMTNDQFAKSYHYPVQNFLVGLKYSLIAFDNFARGLPIASESLKQRIDYNV
jgi:hypothetical protein